MTRAGCACLAVALLLTAAAEAAPKLRLIVETDAGGDPDDEQSLVRFLLYLDQWEVAGIIATRPVTRRDNPHPARTGLGIVRGHLDAYRRIYPSLREHSPDFPSPGYLEARTVAGYDGVDDGVDLIIAAVDSPDPRPVWFSNWGTDDGTTSSLLRALDRVLAERGPEGYAAFKKKIRLCSDDKFGAHTSRIAPLWPLWVFTKLPDMDGGRWYHRFGPLTAKAGGFDLERDVRSGHGPLGALYPTNTNIPQKEGDTPEFLYLVPTGMNDPEHPDWGSWAGRYGVREDWQPPNPAYFWANARDTLNGSTNRDNTLARWAADIQMDFAARMDWCVRPFAGANHPPSVVLNGERGTDVLAAGARPGSTVKLTAEGTSDPDGNALTYSWWIYPEAGTYRGSPASLTGRGPRAELKVPRDGTGDLHVIVTARDNGVPPLTRYRRMVVTVGRGER